MIEPDDAENILGGSVIQPVLAATDFSEDSRAALLWACRFADITGAPLVILHVVHDLASHPGFYHQGDTEQLKPMHEVAESMMDSFLAPLRASQPEIIALAKADLKFVPGLPPTRIVEVAGLLRASLIAIGGRGITCFPDTLLGTTAERVVKLSTIPVVIVKSKQHGLLDEQASKQKKKRLKKDRKRLRKLLGAGKKEDSKGRISE